MNKLSNSAQIFVSITGGLMSIFALALYVLFASPVPTGDLDPPGTTNEATSGSAYETSQRNVVRLRDFDRVTMYNLVNAERAAAGLPTLFANEKLERSACYKAEDMINRDYWAHNTPDGVEPWTFFALVNYEYNAAGENLAYGYEDEGSTVSGWMNSPGHRANILGNYSEMGICSRIAEKYQGNRTNVVVNHFATPQ